MSNHDIRDKLDGINPSTRMDSVYPESMSRLHRGIGVSKVCEVPEYVCPLQNNTNSHLIYLI